MTSQPNGMELSFDELEALAEEYGDRFFLYREDRFTENVTGFLTAFRRRYSRTVLAYSYKTNYLPTVCRQAHALGCFAEVVSRLELDLALTLGVPGSQIIFNGPLKSDDDLLAAAEHGVLVHVDSLFEASRLVRLATTHDQLVFRVGVRCAFELPGTPSTRFGIDIQTADLVQVFELLQRCGNIELESLHAHYVPANRRPEDYVGIATALIGVMETHLESSQIRMIDIGGGFFSPMPSSLSKQFSRDIPDFEDYGEAVGNVFRERFPEDGGPWLVLEPGLAVVADAFQYVCRVSHIKEVLGRRYVMTTGSIDDIVPTRSGTKMPMRVVRCPTDAPESPWTEKNLDVAGYTCREDDILYRGLKEVVNVGDFLVFQNVGAYSVVLKPPFIRLVAPVVQLDSRNASWRLVWRGGTLSDLLSFDNGTN